MIYRTAAPPQRIVTLREFAEELRPVVMARYGAIVDVALYTDECGYLSLWGEGDYESLRRGCLNASRMWWVVDFETGVFLAQGRGDEGLIDAGLFEVTYNPNPAYPQRTKTIRQYGRNKRAAVREAQRRVEKLFPWDGFFYPVARKVEVGVK